jgi:hypothetical protein
MEDMKFGICRVNDPGIIAPVNEKEHIPISSLVVLVSRRNRPNSGLEIGSNEGSLLMSRFCVDFLYLNSNTQAFLYTIGQPPWI